MISFSLLIISIALYVACKLIKVNSCCECETEPWHFIDHNNVLNLGIYKGICANNIMMIICISLSRFLSKPMQAYFDYASIILSIIGC